MLLVGKGSRLLGNVEVKDNEKGSVKERLGIGEEASAPRGETLARGLKLVV
jgi:hypothetical protein